MTARSGGIFKSTMGLSLATMLSRILGLLREILTAHIIGGGLLMSAWTLSLTLPNLFRRILGEGALGTALIPLITHTTEKEGRESARKKFSTIFIWLSFLLAAITVIVSAVALALCPFVTVERLKLVLYTTPVAMPYCILICLIGVATSLLNSFRIFFIPALASLGLNIVIILALILVCPGYLNEPVLLLRSLAVAVLISGVVEMVILWYLLRRSGMTPLFRRETLFNAPALKEIWRLALPGLIGASALQIGVVADRSIALFVSDYAAAALYYSERLIYLPIGIFAVAFGTVSLSVMSAKAAENKLKTMLIMMFTSMRQLLFITIPLAVYMFLFGRELLKVLFLRGQFTENALNEAAFAMLFYSLGIPAYALMKVTLSGFYSRKDMKTPVLVSIACIGVNILLNLALMYPLRQGGIALATAFSSYLNNIVLLIILRRLLGRMPLGQLLKFSFASLAISVFAGIVSRYAFVLLLPYKPIPNFPANVVPLFGATAVFGILYFFAALALKMRELNFVVEKLLKGRLVLWTLRK